MELYSTIGSGRKIVTTAGTREALSTTLRCSKVIITAETDNTTVVTIGGSTVVGAVLTRVGTPLAAGESVELYIDDLAKIYVDAITSGDGVTFTYFS